MASKRQFFASTVFLAVGLVSLLGQAAIEPSGFKGKLFDFKREKQLFTYEHASVPQGNVRHVTNTYRDTEGKLVVEEKAEFVQDGTEEKLKRFQVSQKQLGAEGAIEVRDGEAHFTYTRDGKTKTGKEKVGSDFVIGPTITSHIRKNWTALQNGEKIGIRFGVVDRVETVGFQFIKDKDVEIGGQKAVRIKMKPSSFVIAALVDPLHFTLSPDGVKLLQVEGRTVVKRQVDGKYKDFDGLTIYEFSPEYSK